MYRSIVVPVDGSPFAEHAVAVALAIAERCGAKVTFTRAWDPANYRSGRSWRRGTPASSATGTRSISVSSRSWRPTNILRSRYRFTWVRSIEVMSSSKPMPMRWAGDRRSA